MEYKMECGHTAQGIDQDGNPICVICGCSKVDKNKPDLTGRLAYCTECGHRVMSDWNLAFFQYNEDLDHDNYYCGCYGWD